MGHQFKNGVGSPNILHQYKKQDYAFNLTDMKQKRKKKKHTHNCERKRRIWRNGRPHI